MPRLTLSGVSALLTLALASPASAQSFPLADVPVKLQLAPPRLSTDGDLDFDLLGDKKPAQRSAADLSLEKSAGTRRTMLTFHQAIGLSTLALLAGTVVVGQLNYMDRFSGSAANTARYETPHAVLAGATLTGFAATGLLGLLAPVPYEKPRSFDTTAVHKLCMAGATLGMAAELGLGLYTVGREGYLNQRSLAITHQVIGYTTLGLMTMGASAFIF